MAKRSGLGQRLIVDGYDLSGDVGSVDTFATPMTPLDVTGLDKFAMEKILGLADSTFTFSNFFNDAPDHIIDRLSYKSGRPLDNGEDINALWVVVNAQGRPAAAVTAKQMNFPLTRGADGSLTGSVEMQGSATNHRTQWMEMFTNGLFSDTTTGSDVSVPAGVNGRNLGAASFTGGATLLVQKLAGSASTTCKMQHKAVAGGTGVWVDIGDEVTGIDEHEAFWMEIPGTISRYVKLVFNDAVDCYVAGVFRA